MHEEYTAPELTLAGNADEIVLGLPGIGADYLGGQNIGEMEFLED